MLRILKAKMIEKKVSEEDIALLIKQSTRCVRGKIAEETVFTFPQAIKIRNTFFPGEDIEKLLSSDADLKPTG